jgi:phosphatidylserine decarboxylase
LFLILQKIVPQHLLSRIVGWVANCRIALIKNIFINVIIWKFDVDVSEAERQKAEEFESFNDFFTRTLKPGARPISGLYCSPADGQVSEAGPVSDNQILQAKGLSYSLEKLLANTNVEPYRDGSFMTVYLAPKDYHRVHCPIDATLVDARYVPGKLFSVNQYTAANQPDLFADNERLVMDFVTPHGKMAVVMVGAMIVAATQPVWRDQPYRAKTFKQESFDAPLQFKQGDELGLFQMGSTAIVVLENAVQWRQGTGASLRMGETIVEQE